MDQIQIGKFIAEKRKEQGLTQMHLAGTRYIKCPNCGKKFWQKKVIGKE